MSNVPNLSNLAHPIRRTAEIDDIVADFDEEEEEKDIFNLGHDHAKNS